MFDSQHILVTDPHKKHHVKGHLRAKTATPADALHYRGYEIEVVMWDGSGSIPFLNFIFQSMQRIATHLPPDKILFG
jgi:hypothetical protein